MSLTRRMLKAMGIEESIIEQIIEAHTETTDSLKAERDRYKGEVDSVREQLGNELSDAKERLKEAKSGTEDYDELSRRFEKEHKELEELRQSSKSLQSEFDGYKAEVQAKESERMRRDAYQRLLEEAGVSQKYVGKVLRVTDLEKVEFDDDGNLKDADKLKEGIKSEWGEFIPTIETEGTKPATPPKGGSTKGVSERAKGIIESYYEKKYGKTEE